MTEKERLAFLLSYHHNLTLQLRAGWNKETRESIDVALGMLEEEIESLLFKS